MPFKPGALTTGFFSLGLKVQNFGFGKIGRPANLPATKRRGGSMDGIDPMLALIARNHDSLRLARETRERALEAIEAAERAMEAAEAAMEAAEGGRTRPGDPRGGLIALTPLIALIALIAGPRAGGGLSQYNQKK